MERDDFDRNRPLQSTSSDRNPEQQRRQILSYRSAASTSSSEVNLTSTSSSSLVSSSFSPPCLLSTVQAALKRHRPLGSMQFEALRARRVPVKQRQPSKPPDAPISAANNGIGRCRAAGSSTSSCCQEKTSPEDLPVNASSHCGGKAIAASSLTVIPTSDISTQNVCSGGNQSFSVEENGLVDEVHVLGVLVQHGQPSKAMDASSASIREQVASGFLNAVTNRERSSQKEENFGGGTLPTKGEALKIPASHQLHMPKVNMNFFATHSIERIPGERYNLHPADPIPCSTMGSTCVSTMSLDSGPVPQSNCAASGARTTVPTQVSVASSQGSSAGPQSVTCLDGLVTLEMEADRSTSHAKAPQFDDGVGGKAVRGDSNSSLAPVPPLKGSSSKTDAHSSKPSRGEKGPRKKKYNPDLFIEVNGKPYQKLGKIGTGGSSEVYKVIASDCSIYALKMIKLKGRDYPTAFGFCQEIEYLNKLKGRNNIIQLVDYEVTDKALFEEVMVGSMSMKDTRIKVDGYIYMLLEYGEIDLAHMLSQKMMDAESNYWNIKENWIRFYWQQMLQAVNTIHEERIVHSDLKPANFMLVKGSLKLIDFGIAKAILSDTTNIQRDAQVGTLNYMAPEAFMWNDEDESGSTIKCGRASDIWSLGCILYQMAYGKTPFAEYKTFWSKFKVITDCNHVISYEPIANPWLIDLMKKCLAWNRDERWRIPQLLQHPFLNPPMLPLE